MANEYSNATTTQLVHAGTCKWDTELIEKLDITQHRVRAVLVDLFGNVLEKINKRIVFEKTDIYFKFLGELMEEIIKRDLK